MLLRMLVPSLLRSRIVLVVVVAVTALLIFNYSRPALESELAVSFNQWYTTAAPVIEGNQSTEGPKVTVKIALAGNLQGVRPGDWTFPSQGVWTPAERTQIARVLQFIRESNVFRIRPLKTTQDNTGYLTIAVAESTHIFETTVPFEEVRSNIQLQNLLRLAELYHSRPAELVNPAQL